ncbi:hypothetical protein DEU56DRAFT_84673 [Suillus clintonianus]|uniref:uncharacterized protein n=1 Tax=Suillus clintonianus TaxID=1904413 RepID=UPI001B8867F6|nr:uncharacterized protein DEU56DRAFT_84673 [Suillus clintonianus]KAG2148896.1 hypothetical protein DEU56DRAFT_84673 [Suillus clintonianus]
MDYSKVQGLSDEVRERLQRVRPTTLGAAKRMEGMTPTSAIYLLKHARRTWRATDAREPIREEQIEAAHFADHRPLLKAATV